MQMHSNDHSAYDWCAMFGNAISDNPKCALDTDNSIKPFVLSVLSPWIIQHGSVNRSSILMQPSPKRFIGWFLSNRVQHIKQTLQMRLGCLAQRHVAKIISQIGLYHWALSCQTARPNGVWFANADVYKSRRLWRLKRAYCFRSNVVVKRKLSLKISSGFFCSARSEWHNLFFFYSLLCVLAFVCLMATHVNVLWHNWCLPLGDRHTRTLRRIYCYY